MLFILILLKLTYWTPESVVYIVVTNNLAVSLGQIPQLC